MYRLLLLTFLFLFCAHVGEQRGQTSGSRMYKAKWKSVIQKITNMDSLICTYVEKNKNLEICKKTFENLSEDQQNKINICKRYSDTHIRFIPNEVKETDIEHPKRLKFVIYDKYFDKLSEGDLALELVVTISYFEGIKYLYLLKKNNSGYTISYLFGEFKL